jgi:hypothetical protein
VGSEILIEILPRRLNVNHYPGKLESTGGHARDHISGDILEQHARLKPPPPCDVVHPSKHLFRRFVGDASNLQRSFTRRFCVLRD